jgi:hypothetical protein
VFDRPPDLLGAGAGVVVHQFARPRPIRRRPKGVFRLAKGYPCVDI